MSPSCTEYERIIIKALLEKYAPYAQIKESTLGNIVRLNHSKIDTVKPTMGTMQNEKKLPSFQAPTLPVKPKK